MKITFGAVTLLLHATLVAVAAAEVSTVFALPLYQGTTARSASLPLPTDQGTTERRALQSTEDYDPWEYGTEVSYYYADEGGWWDGTLVGFDNGIYTVEWSDGETDTFGNLDVVDEMVYNANPAAAGDGEPFFPQGTGVSWKFKGEWWDGEITGYDGDGTYTVTWEDGSKDKFDDTVMLAQMADAYNDDVDEDYDPWDINTEVYWDYPEDGKDVWWSGRITDFNYNTGIYTVTWEDREKDTFGPDDYDTVDKMVKAAEDGGDGGKETANLGSFEPWGVGTPVAWQFGDKYKEGKITGFSDGTYYIKWNSENTMESITDLGLVTKMVDEAAGDGEDDDDGPWAAGTKVTWQFRDGWYDGKITKFQDGSYYIKWDDGSVDVYDNWDLVDQMVAEANDKAGNGQGQHAHDQTHPYAVGTPVYTEFKDGWYKGVVDSYDPYTGAYTVQYEDGTIYQYPPGIEMDKMVKAASTSKRHQMNGAGKFFLSVLVLTIGTIGGIYGYYRYKNGKESPAKHSFPEVNLQTKYKDDPGAFEMKHQKENLADVV